MDGYISKPIQTNELFAAVAAAVDATKTPGPTSAAAGEAAPVLARSQEHPAETHGAALDLPT